MNASEGLHRIATVVRWCGWILCWLLASIGLLGFANMGFNRDGLWLLVPFVIAGAASVAASKAIAWVIEGFAKSRT